MSSWPSFIKRHRSVNRLNVVLSFSLQKYSTGHSLCFDHTAGREERYTPCLSETQPMELTVNQDFRLPHSVPEGTIDFRFPTFSKSTRAAMFAMRDQPCPVPQQVRAGFSQRGFGPHPLPQFKRAAFEQTKRQLKMTVAQRRPQRGPDALPEPPHFLRASRRCSYRMSQSSQDRVTGSRSCFFIAA